MTFKVRRPEGLELFEDSLYWMNKGSGEIFQCHVYGEDRHSCKKTPLHIHDAKALIIHHQAHQPIGKMKQRVHFEFRVYSWS